MLTIPKRQSTHSSLEDPEILWLQERIPDLQNDPDLHTLVAMEL
jgi:hypothetical protein